MRYRFIRLEEASGVDAGIDLACKPQDEIEFFGRRAAGTQQAAEHPGDLVGQQRVVPADAVVRLHCIRHRIASRFDDAD